MKVSEFARQLNTTNEVVLKKLKALKLKAKDGDQELNKVVLSVLQRELKSELKDQPAGIREVHETKAATPFPAQVTDTKTASKAPPPDWLH